MIGLLCVAAACTSEEMISQILGILFSGSAPTLSLLCLDAAKLRIYQEQGSHCWESFSGGRVEESKELSRMTLGGDKWEWGL